MFSMNKATAMISGTRRAWVMRSGRAMAGIANGEKVPISCPSRGSGAPPMIYILAALVPPLGLLLNGQPFSAVLNLALIVPCVIFGLIFPILFLVPSVHAILAV